MQLLFQGLVSPCLPPEGPAFPVSWDYREQNSSYEWLCQHSSQVISQLHVERAAPSFFMEESHHTSKTLIFFSCCPGNWLLTNPSLMKQAQSLLGAWGLQRAESWFQRAQGLKECACICTAPLASSVQSEWNHSLQSSGLPPILASSSPVSGH